MNRKQRRAQKGAGSQSSAVDAAALFAAAVESHRQGRLSEAEVLYRRVLVLQPRHGDSLHRLGVMAHQLGQAAAAIELLDRAVAVDRRKAVYHVHRGLALASAGRLDDACYACRIAVSLDPDSVEAQANLALILLQSGRFDAAAEVADRTIALAPSLADGHNILGGALQALGRMEEAVACHRHAIELAPDFAEAHTSLGNALSDLGQLDDAVAHHRRAVALQPGFAEAHNNLGQALLRLGRALEAEDHFRQAVAADRDNILAYSNLAGVLKARGQLDEAIASLRMAGAAAPDHPDVLNNLALTLQAKGDAQGAMEAVLQGLRAAETPALRQTFAHIAKTFHPDTGAEVLRPFLLRALEEGWGRPEDLVRIVLDLVRRRPALHAVIADPPARGALIDDGVLADLVEDALLHRLLTLTPNIDFAVEHVLASARCLLLNKAQTGSGLSDAEVDFYAALAQQTFINEYVFGLAPGEADRARAVVESLSAALATAGPVPVASLLAAASYAPLSSVHLARRLLERPWPREVQNLLRMQIAEPAEESRLLREMPRLTPLLESSLGVQAQYEDNPYPRWIGTSAPPAAKTLEHHLRTRFPHADLAPIAGGRIDVLIAGCGTGRNALESHRAFTGARTLAIDLSTASLAYAQRKTSEMGVTGLDYAQADLLNIAALGRSFDVIEAAGVLHHLEDPFAGWRALLSVLRPGGMMRLGFYSALARRNLPKLEIAELSPDALREARQALAARDDAPARQALLAQDFYSLSGFRDLILHTREHRLSLGDLGAFIEEQGLGFVGFDLDDQVLAAYQARFTHDPAARDMDAWAAFEADHPDTFAAMYQFWVQKA